MNIADRIDKGSRARYCRVGLPCEGLGKTGLYFPNIDDLSITEFGFTLMRQFSDGWLHEDEDSRRVEREMHV
jgi:hypothetical protein